jgi:hypothetical protein
MRSGMDWASALACFRSERLLLCVCLVGVICGGVEAVVESAQRAHNFLVAKRSSTHAPHTHTAAKGRAARVVDDDATVGAEGVLACVHAKSKLPQARHRRLLWKGA